MVNMSMSKSNNSFNFRSSGQSRGRSEGVQGNKIYVSNIDFACTHQELKEHFKKVGDVAFVEMLKDSNQKPKGCAIIRFKQSNIAEEAIRMMNRTELNGRKLVVKDEKDAPRDKNLMDKKRPREDDLYERMPSSSSADKYGNTYGLSIQFLESLGIDGHLVNRVFVANLDYGVNEDMLKEVFGIAGKVLDIELVKDDEGKSKGFGFIEFEHPIEAVQAISMLHNQMYRDRPMSVQLTRKEKKKRDGSLKLPPGLKAVGLGLGINGAPLKDVAKTIDAGNQSSLLGAMPTTQNMSSLSMGGMGDLQGLSSNMSVGLGGNMSSMSSSLSGGLSSSLSSSLTSDLGRNSGMGLMDRPVALPLSLGLGNSLSSQMRSLTDSSNTSSSSNYGPFSAPTLPGQRNVVQITNLPNDYTWKSLQNLCMPFGDVTFAKITSRGIGAVQFDNEAAARRAADMLDHQRFEGRFLETRLL